MNIFIHRRDLRYQDNTTLCETNNTIPIFVFNPEQIDPKKNKYYSSNLVEFLCNSLIELKHDYKKMNSDLLLFEGDIIKILNKINKSIDLKSVSFNVDYSPFAKKRDSSIEKWCQKNNIEFIAKEDILLNDILEGATKSPSSNDPYKVFTPFHNHCKTLSVRKIQNKKPKLVKIPPILKKYTLDIDELDKFYTHNENKLVEGGRSNAMTKLRQLKNQKTYNKMRNCLTYRTSELSAYINLGLLSIREVYYYATKTLSNKNDFIKELYWRDFYYNVLHFFPHVVGGSFNQKYDKLEWSYSTSDFNKWCQGKTGFPVVDACMRQLNTTGFMHNRGRMIVASFLTKDLLISWKWGERYFATQLTDYNISANNGGWQWAAGTGTDAQPYFRIFNPWSQSTSYDPECNFIKKWLPELKNVPSNDIHNWYKTFDKYPNVKYPEPMLNHSEARENALKMYKKV